MDFSETSRRPTTDVQFTHGFSISGSGHFKFRISLHFQFRFPCIFNPYAVADALKSVPTGHPHYRGAQISAIPTTPRIPLYLLGLLALLALLALSLPTLIRHTRYSASLHPPKPKTKNSQLTTTQILPLILPSHGN